MDVVFLVVGALLERENGREVYACAVEGHDPDAEYLGHVHVEEEIGFVVCYHRVLAHFTMILQKNIAVHARSDLLSFEDGYSPIEFTVISILGLIILYHRYIA